MLFPPFTAFCRTFESTFTSSTMSGIMGCISLLVDICRSHPPPLPQGRQPDAYFDKQHKWLYQNRKYADTAPPLYRIEQPRDQRAGKGKALVAFLSTDANKRGALSSPSHPVLSSWSAQVSSRTICAVDSMNTG